MKIQEGPAFGALIIGVGVGYLIYQKSQNWFWALLGGAGIAIADYILVILIRVRKDK